VCLVLCIECLHSLFCCSSLCSLLFLPTCSPSLSAASLPTIQLRIKKQDSNTSESKVEPELLSTLQNILQLKESDKLSMFRAMLKNTDLFIAMSHRLLHPQFGEQNDGFCRFFYDMYSSVNVEARQFVLNFVPILIWSLMMRQATSRPVAGIAACLLAIHNRETQQMRITGTSEIFTAAREPDLAEDSAFHMPSRVIKYVHQSHRSFVSNVVCMISPSSPSSPSTTIFSPTDNN
jgi:Hyccin